MRLYWGLLLVGLCLGAGGDTALAETPAAATSCDADEECTSLAKQGSDYSQASRFDEARRAYEAAYARRPDVKLLFNLARVLHKSGRLAEAATYYQKYLDAGAEGSAEYRLKAEHRLEEARREQGLPVNPPAAAAVSVPAEPALSMPAEHRLEQARREQGLPPPPGKLPPIPALALLGGAGLLIIGIGCGAGALAAANSVQTTDSQPVVTFNDTVARGRALNTAAITFDLLGGLALAGGAAWTGYWLYKRHQANQLSPTSAPAPPAVSVIPMGLGIGIAGRF